jgi:hypothetical protein
MPDSMPVIGRSRTLPCVLYAFGHQHVGWTLGGVTGMLIAELASGQQPSIDLSPYALERFSPAAAFTRPPRHSERHSKGLTTAATRTPSFSVRRMSSGAAHPPSLAPRPSHAPPNIAPRRGLSTASSALSNLLHATPPGLSVVWMAPHARDTPTAAATAAATSAGSAMLFSSPPYHPHTPTPSYFNGTAVPERPTTFVVSAQPVSRPFLEAWRKHCPHEPHLTLIRRGTSLGSIDVPAAKELGIRVLNTPGVNSPHVASFVVQTLALSQPPLHHSTEVRAVVVGSGSVGQLVITQMNANGVTPTVVNRSADTPDLGAALEGATHVAVCAATSNEPIFTTSHIKKLLAGERRPIRLVAVSRPEAFSLEAIMMLAQRTEEVALHFDYGESILAPTREQVNRDGVRQNVTWSSKAMASEACKQDMDEAVLRLLAL